MSSRAACHGGTASTPIRDIQVLCPLNRGGLGARTLNIELQAALNRPGAEKVERFGWSYSVGDKVMQIVNDYEKEVYNGDIGTVTALDTEDRMLTIEYDGRAVAYDFGELDAVVLAYATTIHKAQGSEYPIVVLVLTTKHYAMLERRPIYTGITRGKRLVLIIGQKKALWIAVKGKPPAGVGRSCANGCRAIPFTFSAIQRSLGVPRTRHQCRCSAFA